jgi:hypothetical protein
LDFSFYSLAFSEHFDCSFIEWFFIFHTFNIYQNGSERNKNFHFFIFLFLCDNIFFLDICIVLRLSYNVLPGGARRHKLLIFSDLC